jgi:ABC-type spermidine/putrescine transport system permease subunit I
VSAANVIGLVLAALGALGMWVAGKGRWQGWAIGLATQPVWVVFAIVVHSWTLILTPLAYGTAYARNLWLWRKQERAQREAIE